MAAEHLCGSVSDEEKTKKVVDGGNQQYSVQGLVFQGCKTAIRLIWDWGG